MTFQAPFHVASRAYDLALAHVFSTLAPSEQLKTDAAR